MAETEPRIYVACLAAYNAGKLHGRWINASQTAAGIHDEVKEILEASPEPGAEEWAIHDHEGFGGISVGEYESFEKVAEWAEMLGEHGAAYAAYVGWQGDDYATPEGFEDAYRGEYKSAEDFAYELAHELGEVPEQWDSYIDWEKYARDIEYGGDCYFHEEDFQTVYVFWAH